MFFQFINLQGLDHTNKQKFTSRNVLPNLIHDDILKGIAESIYKVKTNKERRKHI